MRCHPIRSLLVPPAHVQCVRPRLFGFAARELRSPLRRSSAGDAGYALLAVIFLVGVMVLAAAVAAPVILTEGKREKEEELIWRGEQHVRAIRLYYRKYGRFPKAIEDLSKAKNNIRFLRQPYKDVMNRKDGSWRMIYVGPAGQLIGSVTRPSIGGLPQPLNPAAAAAAKQPPAGALAPLAGQQVRPNPNLNLNPNPNPNDNVDQNPDSGDETGNEPPADVIATPVAQPIAAPKSGTADVASPGQGQVFGGNLIGVASKMDERSIKFYKGYGKYKEWEFIWDPQAEAAAAAGLILNPPGGQPNPQQGAFPPPPQQPPTNPPQQ